MKQHSQSGFPGSRALLILLFCAVGCSILAGTLLAFSQSRGPTNPSQRALTLEDRVAYHRAIEDVYWRHRIWPKERPDRKPSLDAVMSQAQLEKKVEDYLRNSQALEDHRQGSLAAEQLQAEIERMARNTKQPEMLRELFQALGNDPFVIAECLAKPVLSERLLANLTRDKKPLESAQAGAEKLTSEASARYTLPIISGAPNGCINDTWTTTSTTNAPSARWDHTAVWTGSEMIVWGGFGSAGLLNTGGRYNPSTDSWTATSTVNAPSVRYLHAAVWTGSEMIIWGGIDPNTFYLNTGGKYNPSTNSWTATSTTNAPSTRGDHTAVWTGSEMIVWGGFNNPLRYLNTGGRYNPSPDSWTATSTTNAPVGRGNHTALRTGTEMIVWGGQNDSGRLNTGGRYNPSTNIWTATSTTNAPSARDDHTAVWTGSEMIIWGGGYGLGDRNTGGRYNPSTDTWIDTSTTNAPTGRESHTAVWTGSEMIVWGGTIGSNFNTGGRYCAQAGAPTPTPTPTAR